MYRLRSADRSAQLHEACELPVDESVQPEATKHPCAAYMTSHPQLTGTPCSAFKPQARKSEYSGLSNKTKTGL